ncbi:cupin domain-containing protein [Bacillus carboniphilus]|uniref:Cupin domain-containing protein n=1 Tax=Bacillus carboniphilus TaxID=86663 RepID=A0ABY9JUJ9_9BACI|nr:cupin domain-containing protein [Bacillus carboniphilus]WLR42105.1 cupin domain-containing protein [Bacillus carboniphilus]
MDIYQFNKEVGKKVEKFNSDFIMSHIIQTQKPSRIGCMYLEKNGIIGYHEAVVPQLLLVVNGEGKVRGEKEEFVHVKNGDAVFWEKGEWHETRTDTGLTAIVIESKELNPASCMPLAEKKRI